MLAKRMFTFLVLCLLFLLSGCSHGPDDELLNSEIQQRLKLQFEDDLFQIKKLSRKGSAPRLDGGDGIYVYYNLELEFLRDYNLIAWRGLNVGTLAVVLGASTSGISGFNSEGNKSGERLFIRGRLGFHQHEGVWQVNEFTALVAEEKNVFVETLDTSSPDAVIKTIRDLLEHNTDVNRSEQDRVTLHELRRSLARIDLGHADLDNYRTIGTGWPTGSYYKFGEAFVEYANTHDFKIFNYASEGSLENGYRLNTGRVDFAVLQSDVAEVLYKGWIEEGQLPSPDLRAIASLWPEAIHVLSLEKSGILNFNDLEDKRVAIGSLRSGTRFTAARIWLASGFERMDHDKVKILGRGDSIKALESGEVDAIIIAGAIPDPAIQKLVQRRDDIRFIPLTQTTISKLAEKNFAYYGQSIPAKTYAGQTESVLTLGVAALLMTNVNTPDEDVEKFMALIQEGAKEMSRTFYRAGFITLKTSRLGISMPLHPAAKKVYESINIKKKQESDALKNRLEAGKTDQISDPVPESMLPSKSKAEPEPEPEKN